MRNVVDSLRFGKKNYLKDYKNAIKKYWKYKTSILVPLEYWFIAQTTQESRFNSRAVSPVGAKGIAQFMPNTIKDIEKEMNIKFNPFNPVQSIEAQVFYLNKMFGIWKDRRSDYSRMLLALASYNAGAGNIIKAQKRANGAKHWIEIREKLGYRETIAYVDNIVQYALICEEV